MRVLDGWWPYNYKFGLSFYQDVRETWPAEAPVVSLPLIVIGDKKKKYSARRNSKQGIKR
jgi:hypothetical protein